jgi:hypothetical protein
MKEIENRKRKRRKEEKKNRKGPKGNGSAQNRSQPTAQLL